MPFHPVPEAFEGNLKIVGHGPSTEKQHAPHFPDDVLTVGANRGVRMLFFPCRGLQDGFFQVLIDKKPPFVSCAVSQVELTLVCLKMVGEHDCHLSNQHGMVMPCMSAAAVGPFLCAVDTTVTKPTPVRCWQLSGKGHYSRVDRFRKPMG